MKHERIIELYKRYRNKAASLEEQAEFEALLLDEGTEEILKDYFGNTWDELSKDDFSTVPIANSTAIFNTIIASPQQIKRSVKLWSRIAVAASIVIIGGLGVYFFKANPLAKTTETVVQQKIVPGKNAATLTLSNGRMIILSDVTTGELAQEAGIKITKTKDGEVVYQLTADKNSSAINNITTAKGETYALILPDHSKVWLNAASSITFNTNIGSGNDRNIQLTGEAYFEVAHDSEHPFKVKTANQEVTVLGTHFNVKAYADEPEIRTTLLQGSVLVNDKFLKPGEQSVLKSSGIKIKDIDTEGEIAWRNARFSFTGNDFKSIMRTISRWYNVEIHYDYEPVNLRISGGISRFENIKDVLDLIQETGDVKFKIDGRRINVIK